MKILSLKTKLIYEIVVKSNGENAMACPECNSERKHKGRKSFAWNATNKVGFCQNCTASFVEYKPYIEKKQYTVPTWKNLTSVSDNAVKWFASRGITQDTIHKFKLYSDNEFMPQANKIRSVICFPFFVSDKLVNIKYRDGEKNFKLNSGSELVFYNINSCFDKDNVCKKEIAIVEGEIDCMSYSQAGFEAVMSVPNGANTRTMEYLDNYIEMFENCECFYIATDNDIKGIELREELIRRLGVERCKIVNFLEHKDANEYLVSKGGMALLETLKNAIEIPVKGIVDIDNQYDEIYKMYVSGMESGKLSGIRELDALATWELGRLAVVTGIPSHGKSEFVDFLVTNLNRVNGWKVGYFSPENYPIKYHFAKIASKVSGKKFHRDTLSNDEFEKTFDYIESNYQFIYPEDDMSYANIIEKAKYLVKKKGIKILVIDPYNKIEHMRERNESETEYISKLLDKLIMFSKQFSVLTILVAHPRKMEKRNDGTAFSKPTLYDINGSANFYNKCDYGLTVYRNFSTNETEVDVIKVKFRHLGNGGMVRFKFNWNNGRYERESSTTDMWGNRSYLEDDIEEETQYAMPVNFNFDNKDEVVPF